MLQIVTIKDPNGAQKFKGFQIRARRTTGDTEELVGDFSTVSLGLKKQFWYPQEENYTVCIPLPLNIDIKNTEEAV